MAEPKKQIAAGSVARNKRAWHDYEIIEKVEAGLQLVGTEVKSLRNRQCDLEGAFARILDSECWLMGCKIAPYAQGGYVNHDPLRKRKLLLHKSQIKKIRTKLEQRGFTLIPLSVYFNSRGLAKVELGLARGKRQYDKRQKLHEQQAKRDLKRSFRRI
ncbi:MAG TPA: SsrA-binding protein SmpB [Phycisphaerales bacterium]|nr:SsrA-binding protein SmpB [Phycisphaerales bacterium]